MFNWLRKKFDWWVVSRQEGPRFMEFVGQMRTLVREDARMAAARLVLETVCDARESWNDDKGFATRMAIEIEYPAAAAYATSDYDEWEVAARSALEDLQDTTLKITGEYETSTESSLRGDHRTIGALKSAKQMVINAAARLTLGEYLKSRYGG